MAECRSPGWRMEQPLFYMTNRRQIDNIDVKIINDIEVVKEK